MPGSDTLEHISFKLSMVESETGWHKFSDLDLLSRPQGLTLLDIIFAKSRKDQGQIRLVRNVSVVHRMSAEVGRGAGGGGGGGGEGAAQSVRFFHVYEIEPWLDESYYQRSRLCKSAVHHAAYLFSNKKKEKEDDDDDRRK